MPEPLQLTDRTSELVLRWPTPRSKQWTRAFLDSAAGNPNIIAVIAVGSAVRPNVSSADIDVLVICEEPSVLHQTPPLEIDLRSYAATDVDSLISHAHDMLGWAVRYGRVLFQRGFFWDKIVESWRDRLPLPSAKLSRERAASAFRRFRTVLQVGDADASREQALSYLTHLARAELLDRGIYPISRPELAGQLRIIGEFRLAEWLDRLLHDELVDLSQLSDAVRLAV